MGTWFSSDKAEKESFFMRLLGKAHRLFRRNSVSEGVDSVMKNSFFMKVPEAIRTFLSELCMNVYGMFAVMYGATSIVMYFMSFFINGGYSGDESRLITAAIIFICSFPLLVSTKSLASSAAGSKMLRWLVLHFFAIPEEKLKNVKRRGGVAYMFVAVAITLVLGAATYFLHPAYVFVVLLCVLVGCLISANPESGVAMTLFSAPLLQYTSYAEIILVAMIVMTVLSYISKVIKHRRVLAVSPEGILVALFCGFILVSGVFSSGGEGAFGRSLLAAIIVAGGFFMPYCLVRGKKMLGTYSNILAVVFAGIAIVGVWNIFYDGIVDGVAYSIRDYVQPIFEGNNIYIADNADVFSVLAILSVPAVFAAMTKKSSVSKTVVLLGLMGVLSGACFIYGTYETLVAILIEFCVFWVVYSHKTFNAVIIALIPLSLFAVALPFVIKYIDVRLIIDEIRSHMPLVSPNSAYLPEVVEGTLNMLGDNLLGIGAGESSFLNAFEPYMNAVTESATDPGSFYLQVVCWSGIGGAAVFVIFAVALFKKSFGFLATSTDKTMRADALALTCALIGAFMFGMVNCIWNDFRMLYLFWACAGLLAGYVREGRELDESHRSELSSSEDNTDVELIFHK